MRRVAGVSLKSSDVPASGVDDRRRRSRPAPGARSGRSSLRVAGAAPRSEPRRCRPRDGRRDGDAPRHRRRARRHARDQDRARSAAVDTLAAREPRHGRRQSRPAELAGQPAIIRPAMGKVVDSSSEAADGKAARRRRKRRRRRRSCWAAAASPAASTRSAPCARSTCSRSTAPSTSSTSTSAPAPARSSPAMLANGVTPEEMMRVLNTRAALPSSRTWTSARCCSPNYRGFVAEGARCCPLRLAGARARARWPHRRASRRSTSASGLGRGAADRALRPARDRATTSREVLADPDRTNDFRLLEHELYLTATDLDTTERIVLGEGEWADVPISKAVAVLDRAADRLQAGRAARAPVRRRRHPLDHQRRHRGRARRQVHRRRQPAGPLRQRLREDRSRPCSGPACRRVSDMGFAGDRQPGLPADRPTTACTSAVEHCGRRSYPGVDIILIEPEPDDELMFGTSIMDYSRAAARSPSTASSRSPLRWRATTTATRRSPSATASRSPRAASATWSSRSSARSRSRPRPGAGCSSRRPRRCCAANSGSDE